MLKKERLNQISTNLTIDKESETGALRENLLRYVADEEITLSNIADASQVPFATLNTLLYGASNNPKIATVIKLAKALNISIDELVGAGTLPELSSESLRLCRNMASDKLAIVRWFIRYLSSVDDEPCNNAVSVMIPNLDKYGNMSVSFDFRNLKLDCEQWKINRCYMGLFLNNIELLPYYQPRTVILIANDRMAMHNENVLIRIKNYLYICKTKTKNGSTNYHHLNDEDKAIDKAVVSEIMGYVIGAVPIQDQYKP